MPKKEFGDKSAKLARTGKASGKQAELWRQRDEARRKRREKFEGKPGGAA